MGVWRTVAAASPLLLIACGGGPFERVQGQLQVTPDTADFGGVPTALRVERALELRNRGDGHLEWSASVEGESADLSIEPRSGALAPGERQTVSLSLVGRTPGPLAGALRFETDSRGYPEVLVPVSAEITPDILAIDPEQVDFGPVRVGSTATRRVEVRNLGPNRIQLLPNLADPTTELRIVGPATMVLPPRGQATLELAFAPTAAQDLATMLELEGDCALGCEARVPIRARGVPSSLVCDPREVDFGATNLQTCRKVELRCTNVSDEAVLVEGATLDPQTAPFSADPPQLPDTFEAGAQLVLEVSHCPDEASRDEALLTLDVFEADVGPRRTTVPIQGRGGGPDLEVSDALLNFGGGVLEARRRRQVTLRNRGDLPLEFSGFEFEPRGAGFSLPVAPPSSLAPGAEFVLTVDFEVRQLGRARGELIVRSNDPDEPERRIALQAEGVPEGQCTARIIPEAVSFGLVRTGARSEIEIELSAGDDAPCWWFTPRVEGDPAFSLVGPTSRSGRVLPGGRTRFTVRYDATTPSPEAGHLGVFRIDLPHAEPDERQVQLTGVAADDDLLIWPEVIDFGARPVGVTSPRSIFIYNAGPQPRTIEITRTGAGPELRLTAPTPPIVLRPNDSTQVELEWTPASVGPLRATVHVLADQLPAAVRVLVEGEGTQDACGHVRGTICAPHEQWNVVGAEVEVRTPSGRVVQTTTDENGRFFAACLPPGPAEVIARQGHFRYEASVAVTVGRVTELGARTCLAPPPASQIAVVTGRFDAVQSILDGAGVGHAIIAGISNPPRLLTDRDLLLGYDMVFLNCGFADLTARGPQVADNLRAFVAAGGSLYVSDLAYDALEAALPDALEFFGDDAVPDAAQVGRAVRLDALALDPKVVRVLGRPRLEITLDGGYTVVDAVAPSAVVHLAAPTSGPNAGLKPLAVTYRPPNGRGAVIYTTVHESAQLLDPDVRRILEHLVFSL